MAVGGVTIKTEWRTREVRHLLDQLKPKKQRQGLSVAVNATAKQVRTQAARMVAKEMGTRRKDIDGAIIIRPFSQPETLEATVKGQGAPLPLAKFGAKQTRKGVTAKAWGKRKLYPGAFLATMKSGHSGAFVRKGKKRLPIKEMWGPGVGKTMAQGAVSDTLQTFGTERLQANVLRQLDRYARSAARRAKSR